MTCWGQSMLGAAWFCWQAQWRFVICRVGSCACSVGFELLVVRRTMMSDKHWDRESILGYEAYWKAPGGGETAGHKGVQAVNPLRFSFPSLYTLSPPPPTTSPGMPSLSAMSFCSEVSYVVARASSLLRLCCQRGQRRPFKWTCRFSDKITCSHHRCGDFKAALNGQDSMIEQM